MGFSVTARPGLLEALGEVTVQGKFRGKGTGKWGAQARIIRQGLPNQKQGMRWTCLGRGLKRNSNRRWLEGDCINDAHPSCNEDAAVKTCGASLFGPLTPVQRAVLYGTGNALTPEQLYLRYLAAGSASLACRTRRSLVQNVIAVDMVV